MQPGAERSAPAFSSVALPTARHRAAAVERLTAAGVECRDYYNPPVHQQPFFHQSVRQGRLPATADLASRVLSLPMADDLRPEVVDRITGIIAEVVKD
jgi:dTDP-4-amino-4,6-dideoxygalactose transaminase